MNTQQITQSNNTLKELPNSTAVLVMGIISLVCFCCIASGIAGIILAIVGLTMANKALKIYAENPEIYTEKSYKNTKAGRVCAIIGICLGGVWVIGVAIYLSIVGFAVLASLFSIPFDTM